MSTRRLGGYDAEGKLRILDEGPNVATLRGKGGANALGQVLTAPSQVKPVASLDFGRPPEPVAPPLKKVHGLRGESVLARRRK